MIDRWANASAFFFLWLIPALIVIFVLMKRRQAGRLRRALGEKNVLRLTPTLSDPRRHWRWAFQLLTLLALVLALARPQSGESRSQVKREGVEIMLLVDVSQSMLAEDVRPSRLELAKVELSRLLDDGGGDKVGLVAFAGSAVTLSPLTVDKSALKMFVESLNTDTVSSQGTDFRKALLEAKTAFERGGVDPGDEGTVGRLVILVSDGEDNEKGAEEAAKELAGMGIRIFSLAVGTEAGGNIPVRDPQGRVTGYLQDSQGREVITKTSGESLKEMADIGRGGFYHLTFAGDAVNQLLSDLKKLEKTEFDAADFTTYDEDYQKFLWLALVFGLLELIWFERRSTGRLWRGRFEAGAQ